MLTCAADMPNYDVAPELGAALRNFKLPDKLGFGPVAAPIMYSAEWANGAWGRGELVPYGAIQILPGARALQYGELVFEGLKAYKTGEVNPSLFRPRENWRRLARSAERLSMPPVPESLFFEAIEAMVGACHRIIPREPGRSLYLRPFLFGTESGYLLRNSTTFRFMVIGAAVGGVGAAKTAANYAASLRASNAAVARGLTVALWLDAREQRFIQELSGMNLFAVIGGELHTPVLDGAILPGITRGSVITLGRHLGFTVHERSMALDELLAQIVSGECTEVFACGTAAIVSPIGLLTDRDRREYVPIRIDAVAAQLREALLAIQERRARDPFGWTREVMPLSL